MELSPWILLLLSLPVLLLGDWLLKHVRVLSRFHIPSPVVGGLVISAIVLLINLFVNPLAFQSAVDARWWTWLTTIEPEWIKGKSQGISLLFMIGFFTCIGLNATWLLLKRGGIQVALFLGLATLLAVFQNGIGVGLAWLLGESPLLGLACGSMTMTGGHGTGLGFATEMQELGLEGASTILVAAATFGLVFGGLIGGPIGGRILKTRKLKSEAYQNSSAKTAESEEISSKSEHGKKAAVAQDVHLEMGEMQEAGIIADLKSAWQRRKKSFLHLFVIALCIKAGAWVSFLIVKTTGLTFPAYIGAMLVGVCIRNGFDLSGNRWMDTDVIENLSSIFLGLFLAMALMSLNLIELAGAALPMLGILTVQIIFVGIFAALITFNVMGRDYDAAIMSAGHCGFGLGATPNAVANMKQIVVKHGPAPRAFLVIPIVGAFLIDFTNVLTITTFLNFVR